MKKITLELDSFEAGLLIGTLTRETISHPNTKSALQPILNRLTTECNKTFAEGEEDDEGRTC